MHHLPRAAPPLLVPPTAAIPPDPNAPHVATTGPAGRAPRDDADERGIGTAGLRGTGGCVAAAVP